MVQANMLEAKTDLSKLVRMLETGEEDVVYVARNNVPVVQMAVVNLPGESQRIGVQGAASVFRPSSMCGMKRWRACLELGCKASARYPYLALGING